MTRLVTIDDVRRFYCASGVRRWFDRNGLDFKDFLENGIDVEKIRAVGDRAGIFIAEQVERDDAKQAREADDGRRR